MPYTAPILVRADAAAAKIETTYGTDPVPTAASNAVRLSKRVISSITPDYEWPNLRDDAANMSFIPLPAAVAAGRKVRFDLETELAGTAPTAYATPSGIPPWDPWMQACGWAGTFAASPSPQWTYAPLANAVSARPSCSIYVWGQLNQYKISGCRGNFEATIRAGQIIRLRFIGEGVLTADPFAAGVPTATYVATVPVPAVSQACTIGPWTPDYDEIVIRSGNNCQWLYSGNAVYGTSAGLQSYDYGISMPSLTITARGTSQSLYDAFVDWGAATARAFTCSFGSVQYNRGVFSDSGLWLPSAPAMEEQKGFTGMRITYRCSAPQLLVN